MCNPHNIKVFGTFLAALYGPDYNQPILKLSLTDFKSSENNSDLGHFKMTQSGRGGVLRDTKKVLVDTPRVVQVGSPTLGHLVTSKEKHVLQDKVEHIALLLWTV